MTTLPAPEPAMDDDTVEVWTLADDPEDDGHDAWPEETGVERWTFRR